MPKEHAVLTMLEKENVKFVDLRFTDTLGKEQHVTVPAKVVDASFLEQGKTFDASSVKKMKDIHNSDMILMPDVTTAVLDPFCDELTLNLRCDIIDPETDQPYERDPRAIAKKAENYLKATGIADTCNVGPELEFFIFDDVRFSAKMNGCFYNIDSREAAWNSGANFEEGNLGHRPGVKGGYFPVAPVDSFQDIRSAMALALEDMGVSVEVHHHEVATAGQSEIGMRFDSLVKKADQTQIFKYVVHNVAHNFGKTATFMPKPLVGDNGSGMHCHLSLTKGGHNLFTGDGHAGLSELGLYFIGGIIKHARALNAFTNPGTNSYKRLVPGFEAPVMLAYSSCNRSAAIRIPYSHPKARRVEIRFPDPLANPYLAYSALLMAGLDGIENRIHPGEPLNKDLYELSAADKKGIPTVCASLDQALTSLEADHEFLLKGGVFTQDVLASYIELKMADVTRMRMTTHPIELEMYYSS